MSQDKALEPESTGPSESRKTKENEPDRNQTAEKKPYKKPELRKYDQIDYVTAYGVD